MGLPPVVEAASETESHGRWVPPGPEQGARMRVAVNDMGGRNVFFGSFCTARAPVAMAPAARRMSPFPRLTEAGRQLTKRDGCHWGPVQPRKGVAQAPETARRRPVRRSAPPVSNPGYLGRPARRRDTHGYSYLAALHRDCGRLPSDRGDARTRSTRRGVRSDTELVCAIRTPGSGSRHDDAAEPRERAEISSRRRSSQQEGKKEKEIPPDSSARAPGHPRRLAEAEGRATAWLARPWHDHGNWAGSSDGIGASHGRIPFAHGRGIEKRKESHRRGRVSTYGRRGGSAPFGLLLHLESLNPSALNHGEWGSPPELRSQVTARPRCRQPMTFMVTAEDCMGSDPFNARRSEGHGRYLRRQLACNAAAQQLSALKPRSPALPIPPALAKRWNPTRHTPQPREQTKTTARPSIHPLHPACRSTRHNPTRPSQASAVVQRLEHSTARMTAGWDGVSRPWRTNPNNAHEAQSHPSRKARCAHALPGAWRGPSQKRSQTPVLTGGYAQQARSRKLVCSHREQVSLIQAMISDAIQCCLRARSAQSHDT
ncbi:hypothetical protein Purlil1_7501 [Purpureocillium lilacinum]|uniref:Uncharacterized protein n=1 Tax=Purpureocillium lilacinum TaxID=33203 RepID=A0ABR0BXX5_PURLI|nr:hypothetical protein Purlil1_7501 [Purpureocillium lilacinum]